MNTELGIVVAGVSTIYGRAVVRWAAAEAHARHAELRLVTAQPAAAVPDRYLPNDVATAHRAAAVRLLADLAGEMATGWPGVIVTTDLATGPPAAVLRAAAEEADLLVVGADDASPFTEAISGSVPGDLLTTSPCPLAVVPRREWTASTALPASAPVVVALDESTISHAALAYGYAAAARTGRPLTVVRCVTAGSFDQAAATAQARLLIAFGELYPDVAVSTEVEPGDPRHVLVAASRRAALLVLGSRGRGRLASSLFGSVSRDLIRRSGCPVVIARTQPAPVALCS
ncbi:universal stress protein [Actinophytocola sp.]|uniref:universal stress protein n=1 Tax=Actinophytocola sp. TaxID=1872138 RepID=UPI0025BDF788|nr:universal stress protein [Actinophytocola sp.]